MTKQTLFIVLSLTLSASLSAQSSLGRLDDVLGYRSASCSEAERLPPRSILRHVSTGGGGIHSWLHVSPKFLSWIATIGGTALIVTGAASDNDRFRKGAIITGSILAPIGLYGVLTGSGSVPELAEKSTVREYESVVRLLFRSRWDDRPRVLELIRQYPELHKTLLFSMRMLRNPDEESAADRAFVDWYLTFARE